MTPPVRLAIVATHPIQYHAPWFRRLAGRLDVEVLYCHRQDAAGQARAGFGVDFEWDVPLLSGYPHHWLRNEAREPRVDTFRGLDCPVLYERIDGRRYDAVLVMGWNRKALLQAVHAGFRAGVPVMMRGDSQLATPRGRLRTAVKAWPYRWFLPRLSAHLFVGRRNRAYLRAYGVSPGRLFFVPHFVDNRAFAARAAAAREGGKREQVRRNLGVPESAFVVLFVGKLIEKKRPGDLVDAVRRLRRAGAGDVHAIYVGDGPLGPRLVAETEGDPGAHFVGFRNQTQLADFHVAADAFALPSDGRETWGLAVNEAMAAGLPAIVSESAGCAPDLVRVGRTGYRYPCGSVAALGDRILRLRDDLGTGGGDVAAGLARVLRRHSMEAATLGLERALATVLGRRSPGATPTALEAPC